MRIRIKVCGVTREEDALAAAECGCDAVGFNFVPGSPRRVSIEAARRIASALPPFVAKVGVFADAAPAEIEACLREAGLDVAQLHGRETPPQCRALRVAWYKALHVTDRFDPEEVRRFGNDVFLLDTKDPERLGGTGRSFDWTLAAGAASCGRMILAGGLHADNVAAAIRAAHPYAVDVNSGVESAPGLKDRDRLALFCRRVAEAGSL